LPSAEPPKPGPVATADRCPLDKPKRKDWAALDAAKASRKASPPQASGDEVPHAVPPAARIRDQERFLARVAAIRDQLDSLPSEERERAYDQLKRDMLGE